MRMGVRKRAVGVEDVEREEEGGEWWNVHGFHAHRE